ncbi:MAG: BNR-4 repeat-containing protein, partial [Gluconacetobacter diazotrophicus]|nr:BNR-4 repeat-containing protein [Gluconacetobacter diazotrophicus]
MDALVAAAPGAVPPPGLRRIPPAGVVPLGRAWSGNSVNCVPFRQSPLLRLPDGTDVASFFDADGQVVIAWPARTTPAGRAVIRNDRMPFDAHQAISLGRDPYGRIHVAFGAHNSTIRVSRSQGRDLRAGFSPAADLPEPPATWGLDPRLTYPMFVRTARELILLFRRGPHADGALHVSRLDEFGAWQPDDLPIASGRLAVPSCG